MARGFFGSPKLADGDAEDIARVLREVRGSKGAPHCDLPMFRDAKLELLERMPPLPSSSEAIFEVRGFLPALYKEECTCRRRAPRIDVPASQVLSQK